MKLSDLISRYTRGECMVLALELSRRYSAQLVGIYDDVWDTVPRHVGVIMSDGHYADARGMGQTETQFLSGYQFKGVHIEDISLERMKAIWGKRIQDWTVDSTTLAELGLLR